MQFLPEPKLPLCRPKHPSGVFIYWMNNIRKTYETAILNGTRHRFGSCETGISSLRVPNALVVGAKLVTKLRNAKKAGPKSIFPHKSVTLFDKEFAKFCGNIWQGVHFSCIDKDGDEINITVTKSIRNEWVRFRKFEMVQYKYSMQLWNRWFSKELYILKKKELLILYSNLEKSRKKLNDNLNAIDNQIRAMEQVDFPYLDMAINHGSYHGVPTYDRGWFKHMVAIYGAWSNAKPY